MKNLPRNHNINLLIGKNSRRMSNGFVNIQKMTSACEPACSCELRRNKAQRWITWTAQKQPEAPYDAEQKFIFRVTSLYNFSAFNERTCRILQSCGLLV